MSWPDGVGKCQPSEQTLALMDKRNTDARAVREALGRMVELCERAMDPDGLVILSDQNVGELRRLVEAGHTALALTRPKLGTPSSALGGTDD